MRNPQLPAKQKEKKAHVAHFTVADKGYEAKRQQQQAVYFKF